MIGLPALLTSSLVVGQRPGANGWFLYLEWGRHYNTLMPHPDALGRSAALPKE